MRNIIILSFIALASIVSCAYYGFAASLQKSGDLTPIQGFAPAVSKDIKLTIAAKVVDMSDDVAWQVLSAPVGCTYTNTSTNTNTGYKKPVQPGAIDGRIVNHRKHGFSFGNHTTAFTIFTNCTSAILERQ